MEGVLNSVYSTYNYSTKIMYSKIYIKMTLLQDNIPNNLAREVEVRRRGQPQPPSPLHGASGPCSSYHGITGMRWGHHRRRLY